MQSYPIPSQHPSPQNCSVDSCCKAWVTRHFATARMTEAPLRRPAEVGRGPLGQLKNTPGAVGSNFPTKRQGGIPGRVGESGERGALGRGG